LWDSSHQKEAAGHELHAQDITHLAVNTHTQGWLVLCVNLTGQRALPYSYFVVLNILQYLSACLSQICGLLIPYLVYWLPQGGFLPLVCIFHCEHISSRDLVEPEWLWKCHISCVNTTATERFDTCFYTIFMFGDYFGKYELELHLHRTQAGSLILRGRKMPWITSLGG
jgi:hypothetical protein